MMMMFARVISLSAIAFLGAVLGTWVADRMPPTDITGVEVMTPVVARGGDLKIKFMVSGGTTCRLRVQHYLLDSTKARFVLPDLNFESIPPDPFHIETFRVPLEFAPGPAFYHRTSIYECNPIQHAFAPIVIDRPAQPFIVEG